MTTQTEKISQMNLATAPLTGNERFEVVQAGVTLAATADMFPSIGASYLTTSSIGALVGSRRIVEGAGISFTDAGAGLTFTISVDAATINLGDLGDVNIPSPTDGQVLTYDAGTSKWIASAPPSSMVPVFALLAPAAGTFDDVVLPGTDDYIFNVDTSAGAVNYTGFVAQRNGQKLTFTNVAASLLQLMSLTGSVAANQIRIPSDFAVVQNQTLSIQYSTGAGKWLAI